MRALLIDWGAPPEIPVRTLAVSNGEEAKGFNADIVILQGLPSTPEDVRDLAAYRECIKNSVHQHIFTF